MESPSSYIDKAQRSVNLIEFSFLAFAILGIIVFVLVRISSAYRWMIFAGAVLGLATSIRVLGPAAAGIVMIYALFKIRKKAIPLLIIYLVTAILVTYVSWPYLWLNPISRFVDAFRIMSNYPWLGVVRFGGMNFSASQLPWNYLPQLIALQFTLPLIILALVGTILVIIRVEKEKENRIITLLILFWFYIPFLLVIIIRPNMYDNFRQFLFITPPLFVLASISLEKILMFVRIKRFSILIGSLLLIPGIAAGIWLHPYEYVYYNALVGWTGNIGRNYENDYWGTSMCEAGRYLSENAKEGSRVAFTYSSYSFIFQDCSQKKFEIQIEREVKSRITPDFSVVLTRFDDDLAYFRLMKTIETIGRGKTTFLVIREK